MDEKVLKIEKLKASMERHKAWIVMWQTRILSGSDKSSGAYRSLHSHCEFVNEIAEMILEIEQ